MNAAGNAAGTIVPVAAQSVTPPPQAFAAVAEFAWQPPRTGDRHSLGLAVLVASLLHLSVFGLLLGAGAFQPIIGDLAGHEEAINVQLLTEADLASQSMESAKGPAPGNAPTRPIAPAPPPPVVAKPPAPPSPPAPAQPAAPPPAEAAKPPVAPTDLTLDFPADALLDAMQSAQAGKRSPRSETAQTMQAMEQAVIRSATQNGAATRKGRADPYGRAVTNALSRTKPQVSPPGHGRVVATLLLSETGQVLKVFIAQSSGSDAFDRAAMSAVWRAIFPKSPAGASVADRTFDVEYNY